MGKGRPDLAACLAVLEEPERAAVAAFAHTLGLDDFSDCPPLRRVVLAVAALRLSADMPPKMSATAKLREACWALLGTGPSSSRLAASIGRQLRRWQGEDETLDILSSTTAG